MSTFVLRQIDEALWRAVRARAAGEGRTLRQVLTALLEHYVRHGVRHGVTFPPPARTTP